MGRTCARIQLHHLFGDAGLCHSAVVHHHFLLAGRAKAAGGVEKLEQQIQKQTTLASQGHQTGGDRHCRVYPLLVAPLGGPVGAHHHPESVVSDAALRHSLPAGRSAGLHELGHQSDTLRVSQRKLQKELPQGVPVPTAPRSERSIKRGQANTAQHPPGTTLGIPANGDHTMCQQHVPRVEYRHDRRIERVVTQSESTEWPQRIHTNGRARQRIAAVVRGSVIRDAQTGDLVDQPD